MLMQPIEPRPRRIAVRAPGWRMVARAFTALIGGYAATAALVTLAARLAPVDRDEATLWAMLLSFLVYAGIALWCFREPRLGRVAVVVWSTALVAGGALWLLGVRP